MLVSAMPLTAWMTWSRTVARAALKPTGRDRPVAGPRRRSRHCRPRRPVRRPRPGRCACRSHHHDQSQHRKRRPALLRITSRDGSSRPRPLHSAGLRQHLVDRLERDLPGPARPDGPTPTPAIRTARVTVLMARPGQTCQLVRQRRSSLFGRCERNTRSTGSPFPCPAASRKPLPAQASPLTNRH